MSVITRMMKQRAVYWALSGFDNFGKPQHKIAPVEVDCRWTDVQELFIDPQGRSVLSASKVYVDRDMKVGSILWLGRLATAKADPYKNEGAGEIKSFKKTPNLKATEFLRTVMM